MSIKCIFGLHIWEGCKCKRCGKTQNNDHDWSKSCEKCVRCGLTRANAHEWDGCKCKRCAKTQNRNHDWSKDCEKCARCGMARRRDPRTEIQWADFVALQANGHQWEASKEACKCKRCGKTQQHDWRSDCEKCVRCDLTRANAHQWNGCRCICCGKTQDKDHQWAGCKCVGCGKTQDKDHDWSKDCEECARCGLTRRNAHEWEGCKCKRCGRLNKVALEAAKLELHDKMCEANIYDWDWFLKNCRYRMDGLTLLKIAESVDKGRCLIEFVYGYSRATPGTLIASGRGSRSQLIRLIEEALKKGGSDAEYYFIRCFEAGRSNGMGFTADRAGRYCIAGGCFIDRELWIVRTGADAYEWVLSGETPWT